MGLQTDLFTGSDSGAAPVGPVPADPVTLALAERLPSRMRFGTSSWTFSGWSGVVYDRSVPETVLAEHGLAAYAKHPLLRTVGVDRSYYKPIPLGTLLGFRESVPRGFRFLLKGPRDCSFPTLGPPGGGGETNPSFLDPELATRTFVAPVCEALGEQVGPLVFQFPTMNLAALGGESAFADRLGGFLSGLPGGPLYAVELRNHDALGPRYVDALAAADAVHCSNVHPAMPPVERQLETVGPDATRVLVVRWMLGHGLRYEAARERYEPFDALVDEDPRSRASIVQACRKALQLGREAFVIVNNKAEGSAPRSIVRLAEALVESPSGERLPHG